MPLTRWLYSLVWFACLLYLVEFLLQAKDELYVCVGLHRRFCGHEQEKTFRWRGWSLELASKEILPATSAHESHLGSYHRVVCVAKLSGVVLCYITLPYYHCVYALTVYYVRLTVGVMLCLLLIILALWIRSRWIGVRCIRSTSLNQGMWERMEYEWSSPI